MNSTPSPRSLGFAVIVIGVITALMLLWPSRPAGNASQSISLHAPGPSAGPHADPATGNQAAVMPAGSGLTAKNPVTLAGEAAIAELREHGQSESLGAAIAAARHAVEKIDPAGPHSRGAEYFAANPGQQLRAWFSNDGVELASGIPTPDDEEPWSVTLRLRGVGRAGEVTKSAPGAASCEGSRVEMKHHGASITQWFENGKDGLEQGFTLTAPPDGEAGEATIMLDIGGNLQAELMDGRENVRFVDDAGAEVLRYSGLKAWDADGRLLPARMDPRAPAALALIIADAGARYPVTVDPMFANVEARLGEESVDYDSFGSSVALVGDSALVGAPNDDTAAGADAGSAYVFTRNGTVWGLQTKLTAADAAANVWFGLSVAISGDSALVGAYGNDAAIETNAGSAYVFERVGAVWSQQAKLTASDAAANDYFGRSVALAGDTALVGADGDATAAGERAGSAYVFVRSGGTWSQQSKLTAADAAAYDQFGAAVALAGDTALIGVEWDDKVNGVPRGSAYVFVRTGTVWSQQAKLTASDAVVYFGRSVALAGDTALVGAPVAGDRAGRVYVFVRGGTLWNQQAKLAAGDAEAADYFGTSVVIAGDTALIGAPYDNTAAGGDAGSAYVFVRAGAVWSQQAKLTATDAAASDYFGRSVALVGDTVLIGADGDDSAAGTATGSAYVFVRAGAVWGQQVRLTSSDGPVSGNFGMSVALTGDIALVGAPTDDTAAGTNAGSAHVFMRRGAVWSHEAKLTAADGAENDEFGFSVAHSGDTALVGAHGDNTAAGMRAGSAYVFVSSGVLWGQQAKLTASDAAAYDYFGRAVALAGDTALVGVPEDDTGAGGNAGGAYVFVRSGSEWSQQTKLAASDAQAGDYFGTSVAISGDTALIGAAWDSTETGSATGSAYVFVRAGTIWQQQARLTAGDAADGDYFGTSVAVAGDTVLVGAPGDETAAGRYAGSAYVFFREGSVWSQQAKLTASDAAAEDFFGYSAALSHDTALVGAYGDDTATDDVSGSAYVFMRGGALWSQQVKLNAGVDAAGDDRFGASVALSGDTALVGAYRNHTVAGMYAGSAYVFLLGELPVITQQPMSRTVVPGQVVTFSVAATGYAPLLYQWRKDGYLIDDATGISLTIQSAQIADQGNYDCMVSNTGGVATSAPAMLSVNALSQFAQTYPGVPTGAQGYVVVTLSPSAIGGWRFAGEQQWRASGMVAGGLATGDRVIEFRPVPGYLQPAQETVGVVSGAAATFIDRVYYETPTTGTGGLGVILKPDSLAEAGVPQAERAQWRLLGEDDSHWRDSEATLSGLIPGSYLVECKPVAGRSTPPPGNVRVQANQTPVITLTYFLADSPVGTPPGVLPFETVATSQTLPYAYVGQIRSTAGASSGFVVKARVVATAGHVVFDDATLAAATGLEWLFERDRGTYEPKPQIPRGFYLFDSYAAQRAAENTPGTSLPQSQDLDAAALYFLEDAGRGGFSGYLASDQNDNEFILSSSPKMLVGYPVDGIAAAYQGRMHATPPANVTFARAFGHTYATSAIRNSGGGSGGPLCVQFEGGNYYPAAIYLGGSSQTVVRSIDSQVIELFTRAEVSGNGGDNNTGGGITHTSVTAIGSSTQPGALKVLIEPEAARTAGAGWRLKPETSYRLSGTQKGSLSPGTYVLEFTAVSGFPAPSQQAVAVTGGQLTTLTFTYGQTLTALESWRLTHFGTTSNTGTAADDADPDHDGQPNLAEYAAGTHPNNAADVFRTLTATKSATSFTVTASGKASRTYVLERCANLSSGQWTSVASGGPLAADGPVVLSDSAPPANTGFYRLRVSLP